MAFLISFLLPQQFHATANLNFLCFFHTIHSPLFHTLPTQHEYETPCKTDKFPCRKSGLSLCPAHAVFKYDSRLCLRFEPLGDASPLHLWASLSVPRILHHRLCDKYHQKSERNINHVLPALSMRIASWQLKCVRWNQTCEFPLDSGKQNLYPNKIHSKFVC